MIVFTELEETRNGIGYGPADLDRRALSARLVRHYADAGLREAVLLLTLDSIGREPIGGSNLPLTQRPTFAALSRLAEQYEDLDLNVETYIALTDLPARDERDDSLRLALARRGLDLYGRTKRADDWRKAPESERTLPKSPAVFLFLAEPARGEAPRYAPKHAARKGGLRRASPHKGRRS